MRRLPIILCLAGIAVAAVLLMHFDAGQVVGAALSVGWQGFLVLLLWQGVIALLLGLAWASVLPGVPPGRLIWGRMVRDAATVCLPFSPVGGYVIGARAVTLRGAAWPTAAAGTVVDVTAEIMAQLLFAIFGLGVLVLARPHSELIAPLSAAVFGAVALFLLLYWQRNWVGRLVRALGGKLLGEWFSDLGGLERVRLELARLYGNPARLLLGTSLHLSGWACTGVGTWISLKLLGHHGHVAAILALEALLDLVIAAAFVVPSAVGVQEAGLVGLGAIFGVPPELALSVSLLRRAREIGWGLPVLGAWQWQEVRRL